ncbi:MAG TPA: glycine cleavage T C-terminal barrel domain-containing protein, partial [Gemmatimonadaceae bacterium]|nr:glycine cleavage T C-terminal barrel domain-containing protein [Gemmatimonadaceae bacterium]
TLSMNHDPSPEGTSPSLSSPPPAPAPGAPSVPPPVEARRDFGDVAGEYAALRHESPSAPHAGPAGGAIVVDRSYRSRGTFSGAKAREALTGLVTNDVLALTSGQGCYAVALTPKGKILADLRIFARGDDLLVDVPPRAAPGWWATVRKYVNPRLARYADVSATTSELGVFGTRSHAVVAAVLRLPWEEPLHMSAFAHREVEAFGTTVTLARVPDLGIEGFSLFVPGEARDTLWDALVEQGARPAGVDALEIARLEAGRPEWGIEMDDTTLAQEANMEALHAISFTKGCYTGQETVARVHFRGHVNRHLRGLRFDEHLVPSRGAEIRDSTGKAVGDVRSAVVSPRLGGIAIAMIRRELADGDEVEVAWGDATLRAVIVSLPFPEG